MNLPWLVDRADDQPLVVIVPSGAAAGLVDVSLAGVKRFVGDRLFEITESRDQTHWRLRLGRLLRRPKAEGPVLTLVFDGLNQEPSVRWTDLLKTLQHREFAGRIRTLAITRNLHFTERLNHLQGLVVAPQKVEVGPYDDNPGGELDQRLALEHLTRDDLHPDLIELARTPRLFSLVVRLRDNLVDGGQVTVHRLLWEYGRDTLGVRDRSLSELDWRSWLATVAQQRRQGVRDYNLGSIGSMVNRPDLDHNDVFRRLSDIVDGQFAVAGAAGELTLSPTIVAHALGAALLEHLRGEEAESGPDALEPALSAWLDPIAGIDERAEILRAAISILLESDPARQRVVLGFLVKDWVQSQNLPEAHRGEIVRLAPALCQPLLNVIEQTWGAARNLAMDALRRMPRVDVASRDMVIARCEEWLRTVSRDVDPPAHRNDVSEKARSARLIRRIGAEVDGDRVVLGERLTFVERGEYNAHRAIPTLLDGYPLVPLLKVFSIAAFALAIGDRDDTWSGLEWLCLLNEIDANETTRALRAHADAVQAHTPEAGVHPDLAKRIAALLLLLTGNEEMEEQAKATDRRLDKGFDYETDYLTNPGRSNFELERRHADEVLENAAIPLGQRINKVGRFLSDPAFSLPAVFVGEVRAAVADYNVSLLDAHISLSIEDSNWEDLVPVLARAAPDVLATLVRRKLDGLAGREADKRRVGLLRVNSDFLLADHLSPDTLAVLAERPTGSQSGDPSESGYARSRALLLDVASRPSEERVAFLLDQDADIYTDLAFVLSPVSPIDVDVLVKRYGYGAKAADLVRILSLVNASPGDESWNWFEEKALDPDFDASAAANRLLWAADCVRFGRSLLTREWTWSRERDGWSNHFASLALVAAGIGLALDQILVRIAPWLIPHAVALRGGDPFDAELAAQRLDNVLFLEGQRAPDLGSDVTISQGVRARDPEAFRLTIREEDHGGTIANLKALLDEAGQLEARSRAASTAIERLREARMKGASLFMRDFISQDLVPIARSAPSAVERWLDGVDQPSLDFQRRVLLAEGFYLALCESLLILRSADGERLWRALRAVLRTRFVGPSDVDQLTLMLYRVHATPDVLRREQLDLLLNHTDKALFEVALASRVSGDTTWLDKFIEEESSSVNTWRRQRARLLGGYHAAGDGPVNEAWPDGPSASLRELRERNANDWRRREVWARHWWNRYWEVDTNEEAYAAWRLLLRIIDRRAHAWLRIPDGAQERYPRRVAHYQLNRDDLVSAMSKAEKKLGGEFLGRSVFDGVHPWLRRPH